MFMVNWSLWFHHGMSLTEIEGMMPWQLDAYLKMTTDYIHQENDRLQMEKSHNKGR